MRGPNALCDVLSYDKHAWARSRFDLKRALRLPAPLEGLAAGPSQLHRNTRWQEGNYEHVAL